MNERIMGTRVVHQMDPASGSCRVNETRKALSDVDPLAARTPIFATSSMARTLPELTPALIEFIGKQHLFFVATAPHRGRMNLSPKGIDTFRVLGPNSVAYLDLTGSGSETAAHILENRRITFMFCAFDGPALILRLYGEGRVVRPMDGEWRHCGPCSVLRSPAKGRSY
jgi:hypothetical protein